YDLLYHEKLIISEAAVKELEQLLGAKQQAGAGDTGEERAEEKAEAGSPESVAKPKRTRKPAVKTAKPAAKRTAKPRKKKEAA
ncbi:MAG: hypothetical protein M3R69_03795, partial [Acidobacteriota bacterium]|nr:hypothetical protein [Acidobacteriota bacterium]